MRAVAASLALAAALLALGCNELTGSVRPVPAVHRVPIEVEGASVLVAEDAVIESRVPEHIARAKENAIPQDLRAAMVNALILAGFEVVTAPAEPHDLVARIALAVREEGSRIFQTYRCGLRAPDGSEVAQIDWAWPQGTYVAEGEVLSFATHNLATEIAMSPRVLAYLRGRRTRPSPSPSPASPSPLTASDAGAAP